MSADETENDFPARNPRESLGLTAPIVGAPAPLAIRRSPGHDLNYGVNEVIRQAYQSTSGRRTLHMLDMDRARNADRADSGP